MQTFMPYPSYYESLKCLDPSRLGNQVYREVITLLRGGWPNHPASVMWRGHFHDLAIYGLNGLAVLSERGQEYPDTMDELLKYVFEHPNTGPPKWMGREDFHASHRSNLLRKDPKWYGQFGWEEPPNLPYVWPIVVDPKPTKTKLLSKGRKSAQNPNK